MSRRPPVRTSVTDVVEHWSDPIRRRRQSEFWPRSIDDIGCFACGAAAKYDEDAPIAEQWLQAGLQRCHLVAHALGGIDTPSNLVMLCWVCHRDHPDVGEAEAMLQWIDAREGQMGRFHREIGPGLQQLMTQQRADLIQLIGWPAFNELIDHRSNQMLKWTPDNVLAAIGASVRDIERAFRQLV